MDIANAALGLVAERVRLTGDLNLDWRSFLTWRMMSGRRFPLASQVPGLPLFRRSYGPSGSV
jgi:hypothetical protein